MPSRTKNVTQRPQFQTFPDMQEMAVRGASDVADRLNRAVAERGGAGLIVPGGTTPQGLLTRLTEASVPWKSVVISLTDERWVPGDDPGSNEGMVRRTLLRGSAGSSRFIGLKTHHATAREGQHACADRMRLLPDPLDVVVLGMGTDGHFASLFPGEDRGLSLRFSGACLATRAPVPPHERMSLSVSRILRSRWIVVLISGSRKREVAQAALRTPEAYPIGAILSQDRVPVCLYWCP